MRKLWIVGSAAAIAAGITCTAQAQEEVRNYFNQQVPAPTNAFELGVGTGFTQGFGSAQPGRAIPDVAGAGIGISLGLGYRIDPHWMIGGYGEFQDLSAGARDRHARGMSAGFNAAYHTAPYTRVDPWIKVGGGYRALWESNARPAPNLAVQGLELAKVSVGVDLRVDRSVALGPMVGADLNMFAWQQPAGEPNVRMSKMQFNTFVYAGVQGTFDLGGKSEAVPARVIAGER
jgi:hypothetical protein